MWYDTYFYQLSLGNPYAKACLSYPQDKQLQLLKFLLFTLWRTVSDSKHSKCFALKHRFLTQTYRNR